MERPAFVLQVRPEPGVPDVIRSLRSWLKQGLRAHGLRCVSIEEINMAKPRTIGIPTAGERSTTSGSGGQPPPLSPRSAR